MTPQRFRQIRGEFESVISLAATEQAAALRRLQARDAELAREVEALLEAHHRRGSFIETPAARLPESPAPPPPETLRIGPYQLLDLIGEGGMGQVWRAEQLQPVRRIVALKLIKAGMDSHEVISRFESERQALALMEHPAIAKVFYAGTTPEGRPFFAMEYVAGAPINTYCDQHRLAIRQRLKLFMRVCEGVQHAHHKAILHRDLKPTNILVTEIDRQPAPKIIDFGVARAISHEDADATMLTRIGAILGTPDYMSPEQASGATPDIDTRTDVYSLGVVLYELLAGTLPLELRGLSFAEMLRRVSDDDAPRPSTRVRNLETPFETSVNRRCQPAALVSELRGDLDAIALKALEKDRARRYDSPADLAADIDRYLHNRPVTARPPSAIYSARKFLRRHTAWASALAALAVLAISFAIWQGVELRRITRERDRADRIARFMTDMFRISDPSESRGNQVTARQILDRASAEIGSGLQSDPELQAQLMEVMGRVYTRLGLFPQAESLLRQCVEIRRRVLGADSLDTAQAMNDLGNALIASGKRAETEQLDRQVFAIRRRRLGEAHAETLKSMSNLAVDLVDDGRYREAEELQRKVLDAQRKAVGPENPSTVMSMANLGDTLSKQGKYRDAEFLQRSALELRRRILGADHPDTLTSLTQLGATLFDEGRYPEAEAIDREVLETRRRVLGTEHRDSLNAMIALANPLESQGRLREAEQLIREALDRQVKVLGPEHPDVLLVRNNLAGVLAEQGRTAEAEKMNREVLAVRTRLLGSDHSYTLHSADRLALVLAMKGALVEAERIARRTHEAQVKVDGPDHPNTADTKYTLACIAANTERHEEALALLREAVDHGLRPNAAFGMSADPVLRPLQGNPAFQSLASYARGR